MADTIDTRQAYRQHWNVKKILCYLLYAAFAKHLPSDVPIVGPWFHRLRSRICRPLFRECSPSAAVGMGAQFGSGCTVVLRECANLGEYAEIRCSHAILTVGAHVMMGRHCTILGQNHKYLEEGYDGYEGRDVLIDDYAWLGDRVIVLPGVHIGKHVIIGAGAVVTKDVPDYAIAVGNPAVVKRYRKTHVASESLTSINRQEAGKLVPQQLNLK